MYIISTLIAHLSIAEPNVKIIGIFDEKLHSPINYWAAIVQNNFNDNIKEFYKFLFSNKAIEIYKKYGFNIHEAQN